jgi:hypothetical protein
MILLVLTFSLCGCSLNEIDNSGIKESNNGMITIIYYDGTYSIVKDNRTGVEYISRSDCGTCVVVDKDGKPFVEE